jgi:hypothetical protein
VDKFDGYTATTTEAEPGQLVALLTESGFADAFKQGRGFHTFAERISCLGVDGLEIGSVSYGGKIQGDRCMIEAKGDCTPKVVEALRSLYPHRPSRLDSAIDWDRPSAFDELLGHLVKAKADFDLWGERRGDWEKPEEGRTQYLGAVTSAVRARLYEWGKHPKNRWLETPNKVRLELQIRPTKDARDAYAALTPLECWGASKWTRQLAAEILGTVLDPHPPGTVRKRTSGEIALRFMCRQYGARMLDLAIALDSNAAMGERLVQMIHEERRAVERARRLR